MGNKAITDRIASASKVDHVNKFNVEELIDDTLLEAIYDEFKSQSRVEVDLDENYKQDFSEFNEQKNEFLSDLTKDRVVKEINEAITTGFSTPDFFIEELKEPRFEKYFQVKEKGDGGEYFKKQYKKFFILYIYYKIKTQDLEVTKKDFYESLESFFANQNTSEEFLEFETNLRFSLSMMREVGKTNPNILVTSLKSLYQSFIISGCERKRKVSDFDFYAEEEMFNEIRSYLIKLLGDKNSTPAIQELCIKLILLIGNLRGSGEDFLVVYNLINEYGFDFNIDPELSQCKFVESKGDDTKAEEDQLKVSYEGSSSGHILSGGDCDIDFSFPLTLTADSDYIYVYQKDKGLFKFGFKDSVDTKLGYLYQKNSGMSSENRYFMYLNGKLYCRTSNSDGKPFTLVDTETLEEVTDNEEFNKKIDALKEKQEEQHKEEEEKKADVEEEDSKTPEGPTLEWTKEEDDAEDKKPGRYLCESPLFTDGQNIYVISTDREIKITRKEEDPELEEDKKDLVVAKWNLEVYDSETWKFKESIEIKLDVKVRGLDEVVSEAEEKETENIKSIRESFSMSNIANCSFATNGTRLLVGENKKWHVYELKDKKWSFNIQLTSSHWGFDYLTNTFWEITSEKQLKSFKIPALKRIETGDNSAKGIIEYINAKVAEVQGLQTVKDKLGKTTSKTLFKNLLKKAEDQQKHIQFEVKTKPQYSKFLIMNILKEGSKELSTVAEEINPHGPVDVKKLELFRGSYSTVVSSSFFTELLNALEKSVPLLTKKEKKSSSLLEQYNLYMLLILVRTSMMCLSKLNVSLSTVLYEKHDFDRFLKILEDNISVIVSKEKQDYVFEEGNINAELQALWKAIENECRTIMAFCLSLVYESLGDLMRKVSHSLERIDTGDVDSSLGIYIKYLTLPETMNKALKDNDTKDMILVVYEKLCDIKTKKLVSAVESVKYESHELKRLQYNPLEVNSEGFIYSVTQNIINQYFEAYRDVDKERQQSKPDKDKLEKLERKLEKKELDLIKVLEQISESTIKILDTCASATQNYLDEAVKQQKEDEKIEEEDKKPKKTGKQKYIEFHRHLYRIAKENNNFTKLMHVYVAAFASLKDSSNVKTLSLLSVKILRVIETFSKFKDIKSEDLEISESEDLLRQYLDKDVIKFFVWTISKLSYSFINVKKVTELSEEEKMNKKILDSKLLSGGVENKYLNMLSKDTVSSLRDLCEITGDKTMKGYLNTETPEETDEDLLYLSIIHHGRDENVDRIIDLLQFQLERKHIWAKTGKEEGMKLSRAAFACMIKIGQLFTDFIMLVDETEMSLDSVDTTNEAVARKQLAEELKKMDNYDTIFKRWESAAKMRSWYQEKKKSWANKVKKEEEEKKKKEGASEEKTDEKDGKKTEDKKTEDKKEEAKQVTVDDMKGKTQDEVAEELIDTTIRREDMESPTLPRKKTKDQIELAKIVEKIIEKAELLVKLAMPTTWGSRDSGALMLVESMSERDERERENHELQKKADWITRLKTWKERQTTTGEAQNAEEEKSAIFISSSSSILACLQSPISSQRIKKQIESIYLNALKRICGFRLIARLSYMQHSSETRTEYLNWFCSSLRHNTNMLTHYTQDVTGCGEHLKNELRKAFFLVFNGIVKQIKECTEEEEIKFLINCCKWQFTASDHDNLIKSGIFEVLSIGNGKKEKDKNPIKYCWGRVFKYDNKEDYPLCQDVLDLFEQILIACFARIVKKDSGEEQKLKTTGTAIPGMEKAHSKVNTTTTEGLIASGFKHVFNQLERYIKLVKKFEGIDWEFYVSKRNSQRKKGDTIEEIESNELDDEKEEQEDNKESTEEAESKADDETSKAEEESKADQADEDKKEEASVVEEDNEATKESAKPQEEEKKADAVEEDTKNEEDPNKDDDNAEEGEGDNEPAEEEEVKDKVKEKIEEKENKEIEKLKKLYEDKYITRFLKLIEIFTSISASKQGVLGMVLKVATPEELTILVDLLVYAPPRHGLTIVKIIDNLIRVNIPHELFDESVKRLSKEEDSIHHRIMNQITPINKFKDSPFVKFLYNYIISIRSSMWSDTSFDSSGAFTLSNHMLGLLRSILNNDFCPSYKKEIVGAIDHFLDNIDKYDLEELEPLMSILNGAEYLGLGLGTSGVSSDGSMFTILGFVKKWYGIKNPGEQANQNQSSDEFKIHRLQTHLEDKDDYILALYYDPKHPERTDIFTAIPEEVRLIPKLEKETNNILLDEVRLNKFLKNLKLDHKLNKSDYKECTIRSLGLKILEQYIVDHGEALIKLVDTTFYNSFLKLLYSEACSPSSGKTTMQNEWIEQKVHALQEYATENNGSLRTSSETKARFADKKLVLTKTLKSAGNQRYSKCIDLISAMNYGRVIQGENYLIHSAVKLPEKEEDFKKIKEVDLRLIESHELSTVDKLHSHMRTAKILLSCDVDIEGMHKGLVDKDQEVAYFRSVVLISKTDFDQLKEFLQKDPKVKSVDTAGLTAHEKFIKEMVEYGGFDRKTLEEILKGNEDASLSKKTNLISEWCKEQQEKKDKEKSDKKEEDKEEVKQDKVTKVITDSTVGGEEIINTSSKREESKTETQKKEEEDVEDTKTKETLDPDTIFGLETNEKFTKIFESVKKYGSTNYDDQSNKPKKQRGTLYNTIYKVNTDNVEGEYCSAVGNYFTSMCRKTIISFFKISQVDKLLQMLLASKKDTDNFIKFLKIMGNELTLTKLNLIDDNPFEDLKNILSNVIKSCHDKKEFTPFLTQLLEEVVVKDSIKGLRTALEAGAKDVKTYFNNETVAIETMNLYILIDVIKLYIKECPELIFEKPLLFKRLLTMLFFIPCVFRSDAKLQKEVYLTILKIVVLVEQNLDKYSKEVKQSLLSLKIFKQLVECINFEKTSSNSHEFKLTDEQKLIFEIFLKFSSIHKASGKEGVEPIYTYSEPLLQMEKCKTVLKERRKFDMISYLMYLKNLDDASKQSTIIFETQHNHFAPKVTACLKNEGFKKMALKIQSSSELERFSSVAVSSDKDGENILKNIFQKDIDDSKTEVTIFSNSCYIHYPYRQPKVIGFGDKDNSKLGTDANTEPTKAPEIVPDLYKNLKHVVSHQSFAAALDTKGELYLAGQKSTFNSGTHNRFTKTTIKGFKEDEDKVVKLVAGFENIIVLTKKGKIFIEGKNEEYQIDDGSDRYEFVEKKIPNDDDPVVDVAAGRNFHLIVTKSGKLYGAGNYFLKDIKLECGKKYAKIELQNNVKALKVFCTNIEKPCVAYVLVEVKKGKTELWSAGESAKGLLGQGENNKKSMTFAKVDYESDKIQFVDVFANYDHTLALTDDGQLYGWGCNIQHRMGLKKEGDKFKPTHITSFKEYKVEKVAVGQTHSLVIASPKKEPSKKMVFSLGKEEGVYSHFGITEEESKTTEEFVTHLKMFDHLEPYLLCAGSKTSFVAVKGDEKPCSGVGVHEDTKCEVTGESPIRGILHFYKDEAKKLHCYSEKGYRKIKDKLPPVIFATKYPLKNLKEVKLPKIKENDILDRRDVSDDLKYPAYITNLKVGEKPLTKVELTEKEFFNSNSNDLDALIFYRISRPLVAGRELPVMNLTDYFEQTNQKGLTIEVTPDYSYMKNDSIIEKSKDTYKDIYDQVVKFPRQCDRELLECLEKHITSNDLDFNDTNSNKIEISPGDLTFKTKKLKGLPDKTKQQRINALLEYNLYFLKTIPYVLLDEETLNQMATSRDQMSDKLNELFILGKSMAFSSIKNKYIKNIVNNLPSNWDQPSVEIKRRRAQNFMDSGKVDHKGEYTIFGQIWRKLKETGYVSMRKNDSSSQAWYATLMGEGSIDAGGPYRETITNLCAELMHNVLPLLIPTPNNKSDHGLGRDCWTINPSATSPTHLEMFEFLGALMGMAFRSNQILDLKLAPSFYKSLAGEPQTIDDLKGSDLYAVQAIKELENTKNTITEEMFDSYAAQTWSTRLSNGEEVELIPQGKEKTVKHKEIDDYIKATLEARFKESDKQMQAIRKGFEIIFPTSVMGILTWKEVEYRIIGPTEIDIDQLKKITEYTCCTEDDEYIQRFWRVFEAFTQEERSMYLKFVWGRSRLPPPDAERVQRHRIYLYGAGSYPDHNIVLPQSHTCFFQLDLPRYTTDAACRDKVLYAIESCGEIDTDGARNAVLHDDTEF